MFRNTATFNSCESLLPSLAAMQTTEFRSPIVRIFRNQPIRTLTTIRQERVALLVQLHRQLPFAGAELFGALLLVHARLLHALRFVQLPGFRHVLELVQRHRVLNGRTGRHRKCLVALGTERVQRLDDQPGGLAAAHVQYSRLYAVHHLRVRPLAHLYNSIV